MVDLCNLLHELRTFVMLRTFCSTDMSFFFLVKLWFPLSKISQRFCTKHNSLRSDWLQASNKATKQIFWKVFSTKSFRRKYERENFFWSCNFKTCYLSIKFNLYFRKFNNYITLMSFERIAEVLIVWLCFFWTSYCRSLLETDRAT